MIAYRYLVTEGMYNGLYAGMVEDHGVLPNNATYEVPPEPEIGFERFFRDGKWIKVEDNRNKYYWLPTDAWDSEPREMTDFGPLPEGAMLEPPEPPQEIKFKQIQKQFTDAIQARLDNFAATRGYDGIMSACSYFGSTNTKFKAEADCAIALRDATWAKGYELVDSMITEVTSGQRPIPTIEEIFAELPELTWE